MRYTLPCETPSSCSAVWGLFILQLYLMFCRFGSSVLGSQSTNRGQVTASTKMIAAEWSFPSSASCCAFVKNVS